MIINGINNKPMEIKRNVIRNALPEIQKRIEYYVPIETVSVDELKQVISKLKTHVDKPLTPEEVGVMTEMIKVHLVNEIKKMKKYTVKMNEGK